MALRAVDIQRVEEAVVLTTGASVAVVEGKTVQAAAQCAAQGTADKSKGRTHDRTFADASALVSIACS